MTVEQLAVGLPGKQIGVTTVGAVREVGGDVLPDPTPFNPAHALLVGLPAATISRLFQPPIPNPLKVQ